jgi:uncharacterized surface protein with fasciclin (FAS1) repeats
MRARVTGVTAVVIGLGLTAAACGSASTAASAARPVSSAPARPHPRTAHRSTRAAAGAFGTACAKMPVSGPGSLRAMASAPVATALSHDRQLSELTRAITVAGLTSMLNSATSITVFAPDNAAFGKLGSGNVRTLLGSKPDLRTVLESQVVAGRVTPAGLASRATLTTLRGTRLHPARHGHGYQINNGWVVCGNVQTANATVYIVSRVLIP